MLTVRPNTTLSNLIVYLLMDYHKSERFSRHRDLQPLSPAKTQGCVLSHSGAGHSPTVANRRCSLYGRIIPDFEGLVYEVYNIRYQNPIHYSVRSLRHKRHGPTGRWSKESFSTVPYPSAVVIAFFNVHQETGQQDKLKLMDETPFLLKLQITPISCLSLGKAFLLSYVLLLYPQIEYSIMRFPAVKVRG
jgi:hypothetical protein